MGRFKSPSQAQLFLSVHYQAQTVFRPLGPDGQTKGGHSHSEKDCRSVLQRHPARHDLSRSRRSSLRRATPQARAVKSPAPREDDGVCFSIYPR